MAKRGIQWVFELIDRTTAPARRISKALGGVQKAGESLERKGSTFGNALAKSLGVSERQAQRLAASFRAMGSASSSFQTIRMRAQRLGSALGGIRRAVFNLPNLIAAGSAGLFAKSALGAAAFKESTLISFKVMTGSAEKAREVMARALNFADITPFDDRDVVAGVKQLMAAGFDTESIFDRILRNAGDLASGMDKPLEQVIRAFEALKTGDFGEAFGAGMGFRQLGITKEMLEGAGLKFDKQGSYVGSVQQAMDAVNRIIEGRFGGMMDEQSKTLGGLWSTALSRPFKLLMDVDTSGVKRLLENFNALTDPNSWTGQKLKGALDGVFQTVFGNSFDKLADMLEPERIGATIDRVLAWLDKLGAWWRDTAPTILTQAKAFGAGVGQGLRDLLDILHVLGAGVRWLSGLFKPLDAAQGKTAGSSSKLAGHLAVAAFALGTLNTLTMGLAGALVRWAVPALLTLGRAALVATGPWGWLALAAITAITLIATHWDKIGPWLAKQWEKIKQVGAAVWARITDAAKSAWQWFKALPGRLWAALGRMWDRVVSAATSAWQWIVDQVFVAWDWLRGIPDNLRQWYANLWQRLLEHTQAAWSAITVAIQGALDVFREFVRAISNWQPPEWWQRFTPSGIASTAADQAFQSFAAGQLSQLGLSKIPDWLDPARTLPLFKFSESVGKELVNGIISGAINSEPELRRAFTGLTDRTTELVRDKYQIRSPSKVFEKIGANLALGMAKGVTSGQAFVTRAVTGMAAATLASTAVAAPPARQGGTVQVQIVINDARDPDRVLEQIRKQFPALVADAFEQLAMEEGVDG